MLTLLVSTAALVCPLVSREPFRPMIPHAPCRISVLRLADEEAPSAAPESWPTPAKTAAEFQAEQAAAKEEAEAAAAANPKPFILEDGGFSPVAVATVAVFVVAGSLFFQGISGGGASRFDADQPPEVQACLKKASTRDEASACLPSVPLT